MFVDGWDPTKDNMDWMSEVINISDVVVTFHTTFVLDVFALDKPVINVYYNPSQEYQIKNNYNLAPIEEIYKCVHYDAVLAEKGVALAKNGRDIMRWIEKYLQDSSLLKQERKNTIDKLCHKIDGQATARIFKSIMDNLR